jgi:hypothetical protein
METNNSMFMNKILNYQHIEAKKKNENCPYYNSIFESEFDHIL